MPRLYSPAGQKVVFAMACAALPRCCRTEVCSSRKARPLFFFSFWCRDTHVPFFLIIIRINLGLPDPRTSIHTTCPLHVRLGLNNFRPTTLFIYTSRVGFKKNMFFLLGKKHAFFLLFFFWGGGEQKTVLNSFLYQPLKRRRRRCRKFF